MKVNIFKCLTLSLLLCSIQLLYAGRIYDEFEDTYKITWIGNSKLISGTTDDWAQRAGDIYRLKIDDPSNYSFLVYELPENEIAHEVIGGYWWLAHFSRFLHSQSIDIQRYCKALYRDTNP